MNCRMQSTYHSTCLQYVSAIISNIVINVIINICVNSSRSVSIIKNLRRILGTEIFPLFTLSFPEFL